MARFIVIDDDKPVRSLLARIIEKYNLGEICAEADDGATGEELIIKHKPDIVIIDLLLPRQDGISIVRKVRHLNINSMFIMLSQVSDKNMISKAYENGIEFFILKPINVIEVLNVVKKVQEYLHLKKTFSAIQSTVQALERSGAGPAHHKQDNPRKTLNQIMADLGILGDLGGKDLINMCLLLYDDRRLAEALEEMQLGDILKMLQNRYGVKGQTPASETKAIEMRMRRTIGKAMKNLATMGIEDFSNEKFCLYSSSLFDYADIKAEMDFLRGKTNYSGKVNIKAFIRRLVVMSERLA